MYFLFVSAAMFFGLVDRDSRDMPKLFKSVRVSEEPKVNAALRAAIHDFRHSLEESMASEGFPGAAFAVVKDGRMIYAAAFGVKSAGSADSIDLNTVFRIASLSKGFAPVLAGMLVDDNLLGWDDRVKSYVPSLELKTAEATEALTLRHVLSHSSGLPNQSYSNLLNSNVPYEDILPQLKRVKITHAPGTYYSYQNVVYSLSGNVIEAVSGKRYNDLLAERIFAPLGMETASTGYEAMRRSSNAAMPNVRTKRGYAPTALAERYYSVSPAAGINASVKDMAQWMVFMLGHRPDLLSRRSLQEICSPQVSVSEREGPMRRWRPLEEKSYGLGWRILGKSGRKIVYHGGFVNGYRSEMVMFPEEDLGIVLLCNSVNGFVGRSMPLFYGLYFDGVPLPSDGESIDDEVEELPVALPNKRPAAVRYGN